MLSIFLIGIALSMDAFSLAVCIGTTYITKSQKLLLSGIVGIMHFIMPQLGLYLGNYVTKIFEINADIFIILVFIYLGTHMILNRNDTCQFINYSLLNCIIFAFSVSIDSFSVGLFMNSITNHSIMASLMFAVCSSTITYIGILIGEYSCRLLKEKAPLLGGLLLYILAVVNLFEHFF